MESDRMVRRIIVALCVLGVILTGAALLSLLALAGVLQ